MNVFVGWDVSLRSVALCVIDGDGAIIEERTLDFEVVVITPTQQSKNQIYRIISIY